MPDIQPYNLQPKQVEFHTNPAKFRLYGGANGGGKSYAMRAECVAQCCTAPFAVNGLVLRRTLPEIKQNMIRPLEEELPDSIYSLHRTDNIMTFFNGSTITFGSAERESDLKRWQGIGFDFMGIEELTHWTEPEFRTLTKSLRTAKKGWRPNFFASCNPGGIGHQWVKRLFVDRQFKANERPEDYAFIPARVYDNFALMEADPGYAEVLKALPEKQRRAALEGDWNAFEGQYFEEFRTDIHVCAPFMPIAPTRRIIAIDYGYSNPSCVLWGALDTQGRVWIYRELYSSGLTYENLAKNIAALTTEGENIDYIVVDPAALEKANESTGTSMADDFARVAREISCPWLLKVQKAKNSRIDGWNLVRRYLHPYTDPNSRILTAALRICRNCENLIRTLPEQQHDKRNVEDLDTKGEDHPPDTLRYLLQEFGINILNMKDIAPLNQMMHKGSSIEKEEQVITKSGQPAKYKGDTSFFQPRHTDSGGGGDNILTMEF